MGHGVGRGWIHQVRASGDPRLASSYTFSHTRPPHHPPHHHLYYDRLKYGADTCSLTYDPTFSIIQSDDAETEETEETVDEEEEEEKTTVVESEDEDEEDPVL